MITILTAFKNFSGDDSVRQCRALDSWRNAFPEADIIAYGKPVIPSGVISEYHLRQFVDIPMANGRLVRIDAMFAHAQRTGRNMRQMYVNGDMILGADFARAMNGLPHRFALAVGQRWDCDLPADKRINNSADVAAIQTDAKSNGSLHPPNGMDYFVYSKGDLADIGALYLGAVGWDNYMVARALTRRMSVIDMTPSVVAVHQNHGYGYLKGGQAELEAGEAAQQNLRLLAGVSRGHRYWTIDATHELVDGSIRPARRTPFVEQRMLRLYRKHPWLQTRKIPWKLKWVYCWANLRAGA